MSRIPRSFLGVLLLVPSLATAQQGREPYAGLDAYVDAARRTWQVPGVGIAIVRNDSLIYARGFGVREIGKPEPVTEKSLFAIGSSSKAFTAAGVAMLVDEKKVSLDAAAATYLPGFQLADPYASRELTVRDLLAHRSGLARGELAWYGSGYDRDEILRRVRYLQPTWSFRSQFGYQNIMYIAAGQVIAKAGNTTWDDFVRTRIFVPLGMTSSTTSVRDIPAGVDRTMPHVMVNDTVRALPAWRNIDNAGAAGSINSNVVDVAQWVRLQLGRGSYAGKRLISTRLMDEMHAAHTVIRIDSAARAFNPDTHLSAYGLGWFLEDYKGKLVVHHGGNIDGYTALVGMLPEEKLGVVILTNMNGTGLPTMLLRKIFDLHLKAPARDWAADGYKRLQEQQARARQAAARQEAARVKNTRPTLPIAEYAGTYVDSLYGEVVVTEKDGTLSLQFGPNWKGTLEHWHYDTFRTRFDTPVLGAIPVHFRLNAAAKADELQLDMAGSATFRRKPDPPPANRAAQTPR
jgi:CubicO group peptidase (beta-lactamase class C family)